MPPTTPGTIPPPHDAAEPSHGHVGGSLAGLTLGALGIVFGDIGTSPLYTLHECTSGEHGAAIGEKHRAPTYFAIRFRTPVPAVAPIVSQ